MKELARDVVIALALALLILQFVRPTIVKESSMEPTLYENNYLFLSKQAYRSHEPEYGDIIVFKSGLTTDSGQSKLLIKRVIGRPGDTIAVKDNKVYRNGELLKEDYIKDQDVCPGELEVTVPEGELFVMGDNREVSVDSRYEEVGCVDIDDVVGKAVFRLFPFNKMGKL